MLNFAEELVLLLLDDDTGEFLPISNTSKQCALTGAVLMDLAWHDRIDTDLKALHLINPTPLEDSEILSLVLSEITSEKAKHDIRYWIERIAERYADEIQQACIEHLIDLGILSKNEDRFLWVFRSRRYPMIDGKAEQEVKMRIMEVLFNNSIPHPRDVALICLADVCGIFSQLLSMRELEHVRERIDIVRKLDLIGQELAKTVREIENSLSIMSSPVF